MESGRWRQIEQLYHAALEREASQRSSFLEQSCAADPSLRQEVESLLSVADDADGYLKAAVHDATPQVSGVSTAAPSRHDLPPIPRTLGRYEILEQVGKGGMGVVYRAVDPAIGRIVAIKTIRFDDAAEEKNSELRARLLRESQAGGQLSHSNIVAVYDVSEQGALAGVAYAMLTGRPSGGRRVPQGTLEEQRGALRNLRPVRRRAPCRLPGDSYCVVRRALDRAGATPADFAGSSGRRVRGGRARRRRMALPARQRRQA